MAEALYLSDGHSVDWTPTLAITAGDVIQFSDGRAAFAPDAIAAGRKGALQVTGIATVKKVVTQTFLKGSRIFWDHSANTANLLQVNDRDFPLGIVQEDAAYAATTCKVALNQKQRYTISLGDGFVSLPIGVTNINAKAIGTGEGVNLIIDAKSEAQKMDALSLRSIAVGTPCIVDALLCVNVNGSGAAVDFNVGLASDTHATDADSIVNSLFAHFNGSDLEIYFESDNVTAEHAAADSTIAFVVGTPFLVQFDLRTWADIQCYVNGVLALPAEVFTLAGSAGPIKLLAHLEKTTGTTVGNYSVMRLGIRTFEE